MVVRYRSLGISLIEMMVVVAIIGLLAVVAIPFTGAWTTSSHIQSARGSLMQAHAQAKAVALRGHFGQLAWDNDTSSIFACKGAAEPCDQTSADLLWSAKTPKGVSLDMPGLAGSAGRLLLDGRGRPLDADSVYLHSVTFVISKGNDTDELALY